MNKIDIPERRYTSVSAFSSSKDVSEAQQEIDHHVSILKESIRALNQHRNAIVLISRLPPEILCKVFAFIPSGGRKNRRGIRLSHVCSHWRAVALECPSLWISVPFSNLAYVEEMMKRSKAAPLDVVVDLDCYPKDKKVACLRLALEHIHRIRELSISRFSAALDSLLACLCSPAPLLESLCLTLTSNNALPIDIFMGNSPRLRHLELSHCDLPWDSPILNGITQLKIHFVSPSARPSTTQLIAALERMPKLETLDLQDTLPSLPVDTATFPPSERIIDLPCLSYIHISSDVLGCAHLLNHLSYPADADTKFICWATADGLFSSLLPAISRSRGSGGEKHIRIFSVQYFQNVNTITLKGWNSPCDCTTYGTPLVHIEFVLGRGDKTGIVARAFCRALYLKELETLDVLDLVDLRESTWMSIFGRPEKLKRIRVRANSGTGLTRALTAEIPVKRTDIATVAQQSVLEHPRPAGVYFSGLHRLEIEGWDFGKSDDPSFDDLRTCLMKRYEHGAQVDELKLDGCRRLSHLQVHLLEEIVVDVDWDGSVITVTETEIDDIYPWFN